MSSASSQISSKVSNVSLFLWDEEFACIEVADVQDCSQYDQGLSYKLESISVLNVYLNNGITYIPYKNKMMDMEIRIMSHRIKLQQQHCTNTSDIILL